MAKQNITFIERHAEKIIIGVTGAVLLAVAVFYLVTTPNKVETGMAGKTYGPGEFYNTMREQAQNAQRRLQNAKGPAEIPPLPEEITRQPAFSAQLARIYSEPLPPVAELEEEEAAKVRLAQILPPSRPAVTAGRGMGNLPESQTLTLGIGRGITPRGGVSREQLASTQEIFWITACAAVFRQQQLQLFKDAQYHQPFLLVDHVEVERQQLGPDGNWLPAEQVQPYRETQFSPPSDFSLLNEQGQYSATQRDRDIIRRYHESLESDEDEVLRPFFKTHLEPRWQDDWTLPNELPGINLNPEQYAPKTRGLSRTTGSQTDRTSGPRQTLSRSRISRQIDEAEQAFEQDQFDEGQRLLKQVLASDNISDSQRRQANSLLEQYSSQIHDSSASRRGIKKDTKPDIDLLWINDTTIKPGATYRYRIRLGVFNQYAGWPTPLQNRNDAAKLVLKGQWSEWSTAITAEAEQYIFFAGARESEQSATVEIYQWDQGVWSQARNTFTVGQPLNFPDGGLSSDLVVADIDFNRNCIIRRERPDGSFSCASRETSALSLIDPDGQVHEHLEIQDKLNQKRKQIRKEMEEQQRPRRQAAR